MLQNIVQQQKDELEYLISKPYHNRQISTSQENILASPLIKLITGPRRAGKSVFALQLLASARPAYLNFDDTLLLKEFDEEIILDLLFQIYPDFTHILLDEIQNLPDWESWVGKLYRRGFNLVITGSNSKLLSGELATRLTGRFINIEVLPFSLAEYLESLPPQNAVTISEQNANKSLAIIDYLQTGGFPETVRDRSIAVNYLKNLFDSILLRDISRRYRIRQTSDLYNLAQYLANNCGQQLSITKIAADIGLGSKLTTQRFCDYLAECYLFFFVPRFNNKLKIMQKAPQKCYLIDNGFISANNLATRKNMGFLLENMVADELLRRGFKPGLTLFYYHTKNGREIDFVCKEGAKISALIQVSYQLATTETRERELKALAEAAEELSCKNLIIITFAQTEETDFCGLPVKIIRLQDWEGVK